MKNYLDLSLGNISAFRIKGVTVKTGLSVDKGQITKTDPLS